MARVKQVLFFGIVIVVFAIFTDFMINVGLKNTYKDILGQVKITSPEIVMTEVKTTDVNGYAKGTIKNNLNEDIDRIYIKIDLYSYDIDSSVDRRSMMIFEKDDKENYTFFENQIKNLRTKQNRNKSNKIIEENHDKWIKKWNELQLKINGDEE